MDHKEFIDNFPQVACVLSIDLTVSSGPDRIRIVEANDEYIKSVGQTPETFKTNIPYTEYITKDINFESMAITCATQSHPIHAYVDAELYNAWMDIYMQPLKSDNKDYAYCLFSYQLSPKAEADKLTDVSSEVATHVLKTCIKLRETPDFQKAMDSIIADIRQLCSANRCCILLTDFKERKCSLLCESIDDPDNPLSMTTYLDDHFFDVVETWPKVIAGSNCFIIEDEEDMEYAASISPIWAESLRYAKVTTLVIYPLKNDGETIGYIWANNFDASRTLKIKETLEVTTFILTAEIANHQMLKQMKIMSCTDLLTGVYNRNAMNNRIMDNDSGLSAIKEPFGVFFVDVNGLKTTNDTMGHLAGDNLLKDVAYTLKDIFNNYEVYRVGGDEFLVICTSIAKDDFAKLENELCSTAERPNRAHYAIGSCFSDEATETHDIRKAMQYADVRMYTNKEAYYKRHPEYEWDRRNSRKIH